MSDALPLKYRPKNLDEVYGNKQAIASIESIFKKDLDKIPRSWLFTGPSGCGKTTIARILKTLLDCHDMSFYEFNASNTRGIDTIRKVQQEVVLSPRYGDVKIYLFDEGHMLTKEAMNALLKLLEDGPADTFFFIATTNPEKLIQPIRSRCTNIQVTSCPPRDIQELVEEILYLELGEDHGFPEDVIDAVVKNSNGACRDALKLLDMIIDMTDFDDMIDAVQQGYVEEGTLKELCMLLKTPRTDWPTMAKILKGIEEDPEGLRRAILSWFTKMLLDDGNVRTAMILECFEKDYFSSGKSGLVLSCFQAVNIK